MMFYQAYKGNLAGLNKKLLKGVTNMSILKIGKFERTGKRISSKTVSDMFREIDVNIKRKGGGMI